MAFKGSEGTTMPGIHYDAWHPLPVHLTGVLFPANDTGYLVDVLQSAALKHGDYLL